MDPQDFRDIMRHYAGAVTIIAVGRKGNRTGLTATAVCSLSDSPPSILACVNRNASAHPKITDAGCFSINLLALGQDATAMRFAGKVGLDGESRFDEKDWTTLVTGAPILEGALANLDCEVIERQDTRTHTIFIGAVKAGRCKDNVQPLIYFRGAFTKLAKSK
jgi:flavin reductase (DIM6/NTAB) family NADH-FMN oxidoreductase RutF